VQVARGPLGAVVELEVLARDDTGEEVLDAVLDLPVEDLGVEGASGVHIVGRKVDEDQDVRVRHVTPLFGRCRRTLLVV
jgi:hypothetical protein